MLDAEENFVRGGWLIVAMQCLIAHAIDNESGENTGGHRGDQNGFELCACKFYEYPVGEGWTHIYRFDDDNKDKAEGVAAWMEEAVTNGHIGYNQNRTARKNFFEYVRDVCGMDVNKVCENHSTDCGGIAFAAIYSQTGISYPYDSEDNSGNQTFGVPTVGFYDDYFRNYVKTGVIFLNREENPEYFGSPDKLERGDILRAGTHHVAIWI